MNASKYFKLTPDDAASIHYMIIHSIKHRKSEYERMSKELEEHTNDLGIVDHEEEVQQISEQLNDLDYHIKQDEKLEQAFGLMLKSVDPIGENLRDANKLIEIIEMYGRINHDRPRDYKELCDDYYKKWPREGCLK